MREIKFLRELGDYEGVLPVVDARLPQAPSSGRPWLALPVAPPITEALTDAPLDGRDIIRDLWEARREYRNEPDVSSTTPGNSPGACG